MPPMQWRGLRQEGGRPLTENRPTPTPEPTPAAMTSTVTDVVAIRDRLMGIVAEVLRLDLAAARQDLESKFVEHWTPEDDELLSLLMAAADFQEVARQYQAARSAAFWARPGLPREERPDAGLP